MHLKLQNDIAKWNEENGKYINVVAFSELVFEKVFLV